MYSSRVKNVIFPVVFGIVLIALWQMGIFHKIFNFKVLQLPYPLEIVTAFVNNIQQILNNLGVTMLPFVIGILLGSCIGYGIAVLVTIFPNGCFGCLILVTIINSVPIVALAPLMNRWFESDLVTKVAIITVASIGPMAVTAFRGLCDLPENTLDLMCINVATKCEILKKLRIPNSLPSIFTAFKISVPTAITAAVISEFFSSETSGLGYMIKFTLKVGNQKPTGWAYILALSLISVVIYTIICFINKLLVKHTTENN